MHDAGTYELTAEELGSEFVLATARVLVDPQSAEDEAVVAATQDGVAATSVAGREYASPDDDQETLHETADALKVLTRGMTDVSEAFGRRDEVERLSHLVGAALGWGGLPRSEALYVNISSQLPDGEDHLRIADVPVDGWNYLFRFYRPRPDADAWMPPELVAGPAD